MKPRVKEGCFAGVDWSGTPDPPRGAIDLYSFCVAAFGQTEAVNEACRKVRLTLGMSADEEFHAHGMSDAMIAAVLEMGLGLEMRVGMLMVNKSAVPLSGRVALPEPSVLTAQVALRTFERFLPVCPLRDVWCDEEVAGKKAQQEFATAARKVSGACSPVKMKARFRASHTSSLIQMADVANYALRKEARGAKLQPALVNVLRAIRADSRHLILGPVPWEQ